MFVLMITGAVIFLCGFLYGRLVASHIHGKQDEYKEAYKKEYGRTNGLYEPVRRDKRGE